MRYIEPSPKLKAIRSGNKITNLHGPHCAESMMLLLLQDASDSIIAFKDFPFYSKRRYMEGFCVISVLA